MSEEEQLFHSIGSRLLNAEPGQLFGKPCYKVNGKAFICFFSKEMVFKLRGESHRMAMSMEGSQLFDPSGKKRPMKEWVQISFKKQIHWEAFAKEALAYIQEGQ